MFEKLAVFGTGAIGSVIGGYLSRSGQDITLIDAWGEHVDAMRQNGLAIDAVNENFTAPVKAMHLGEVNSITEPFDAVFLAVKSYDTTWATHFILPHIKPTGVIISAQNGVNDEVIASVAGFTKEVACVITLGAGLYEPGRATHTGDPNKLAFTLGELNGMRTQRVNELASIMNAIGSTKVTTNIWGERWAKLATNCMANPVSASTGLGSAAVRQTPGIVDLSVKIASEVVNVGKALGIQVEPISGVPADTFERADDAQVLEDLKTRLAESAVQLGAGRPSMLQDVMKGRRTEIEYLNRYVARRGKEVGVSTPINEAINRVVNQVERGELKPNISNIEYLQQYL